MITEKCIKNRMAEILTEAGFNVFASEVDEGFQKPAVFVAVYPSTAVKLTCGGATEEVTDTVEIKYISALETDEDCIEAAMKLKQLFFYHTFDVKDRRLTIQEINFEIEKSTLYTYFDLTFIQDVEPDEEFEPMEVFEMRGNV